jgi:hypothetical protein
MMLAIACSADERASPAVSPHGLEPPAAAFDAAELVVHGEPMLMLEARTLSFVPSRSDFTVRTALFSVFGAPPEDVERDGVPLTERWNYLELPAVGPNQFAFAASSLRWPADRNPLVCLSIKVWFAEVGNQYDGLYYRDVEDRYALVSYCTRSHGADWAQAEPRFSQNRVASVDALLDVLRAPIAIELNDRPLGDHE